MKGSVLGSGVRLTFALCGHRTIVQALRPMLGSVVLLLASLAAFPLPAQSAVRGETEVQAALLVNFIRYTQWPAQSFDAPDAPYVVTVISSDQVAKSVRAVLSAAPRVNGHPIVVRVVSAPRGSLAAPAASQQDREVLALLRRSHVVFFHSSAGNVLPEAVLADLWNHPVLTVSNLPGFTSAGGMLGLVKLANHVAFEANPVAIRHARLLVSAKVLKLARRTRGSAQ